MTSSLYDQPPKVQSKLFELPRLSVTDYTTCLHCWILDQRVYRKDNCYVNRSFRLDLRSVNGLKEVMQRFAIEHQQAMLRLLNGQTVFVQLANFLAISRMLNLNEKQLAIFAELNERNRQWSRQSGGREKIWHLCQQRPYLSYVGFNPPE